MFPKITDFEYAGPVDGPHTCARGTLAYVAPEVQAWFDYHKQDPKPLTPPDAFHGGSADSYSLGSLLFTLRFGGYPPTIADLRIS